MKYKGLLLFFYIISDEKKFVRFDANPFLFPFDWLRKQCDCILFLRKAASDSNNSALIQRYS